MVLIEPVISGLFGPLIIYWYGKLKRDPATIQLKLTLMPCCHKIGLGALQLIRTNASSDPFLFPGAQVVVLPWFRCVWIAMLSTVLSFPHVHLTEIRWMLKEWYSRGVYNVQSLSTVLTINIREHLAVTSLVLLIYELVNSYALICLKRLKRYNQWDLFRVHIVCSVLASRSLVVNVIDKGHTRCHYAGFSRSCLQIITVCIFTA